MRKLRFILAPTLAFVAIYAFAASFCFGAAPESEASDSLAPGAKKTINILGKDYVFHWIPAGSFVMGSPKSEEERGDNETQHDVTLTRGFWMAETEVTQELWKSTTGSNPSKRRGEVRGFTLPVENVSWIECQDFVNKLNDLCSLPDGMEFRLPTEAEWEYACRAGSSGVYNAQDLDSSDWYDRNCNWQTHPVGSKSPNAWGLYDMHGNVCEWCADWYENYSGEPETDPKGSQSGAYRVIRGGCWIFPADGCRSARRGYYEPSYRGIYLGLRLALSAK